MQIDESKVASNANRDEQVQARGVVSNHTSNLTSSQSQGVSLKESSSRMERSEGLNAREAWLVGGERERSK